MTQKKAWKIKKRDSRYLLSVTSNLTTEENFKQFAQKMSGVLSILSNCSYYPSHFTNNKKKL